MSAQHIQTLKSYIERVKDRLSKRKSAQSSDTGDDETFDWWDMIHQSREVQKKIGDFGTRPRDEDDIVHKPTCKYYRGNGNSSSKQAEKSKNLKETSASEGAGLPSKFRNQVAAPQKPEYFGDALWESMTGKEKEVVANCFNSKSACACAPRLYVYIQEDVEIYVEK